MAQQVSLVNDCVSLYHENMKRGKVTWEPVLYELHIGGQYIGYVEKVYSGKRPWGAYLAGKEEDESRHQSLEKAQRALLEAQRTR